MLSSCLTVLWSSEQPIHHHITIITRRRQKALPFGKDDSDSLISIYPTSYFHLLHSNHSPSKGAALANKRGSRRVKGRTRIKELADFFFKSNMAKAPVRFRRVAAAFNDQVARARLCESSGSERSPESSTDLSNLVKSFMEREGVVVEGKEEETERNETELGGYWCDSEKIEMLQDLVGCKDDCEKQSIYAETDRARRLIGDRSSEGFKSMLMTQLRDRGFDAGLCISRWEKSPRFPAGNHEYVDVNLGGSRYILEVNLAAEFEIARPTDGYMSLLCAFPPIFVGKPEELKQIVRLMSAAVKESIKRARMQLAPWRRNGYMQAKWFGSYKRTTNAISATETSKSDETNRSIGFVAMPVGRYYCGNDYASKVGLKVGQLTAAFSDN